MTVAANYTPDVYDGDDVTTDFTVTFYFLKESDLTVLRLKADGSVVEEVPTAVTGAGDENGGSVSISTALLNGEKLFIKREPDDGQPTNFENASSLPAATVMRAVDRLAMQHQYQKEQLLRSVKLPETYVGEAELVMPEPTGSAAVLGYNAAGQLVADVDFQSLHDQAVAANTAAQAAQTAAEDAQAVAEAKAAELDTMLTWKVQLFEGAGTQDQELVLDTDPGSADRIFVVVDGLEVYNQAGSVGTWDYVVDNGTPKVIGIFAAPAPGYEGTPNVQVRYGVPSPYAEPPDGSITPVKLSGDYVDWNSTGLIIPKALRITGDQSPAAISGTFPSYALNSDLVQHFINLSGDAVIQGLQGGSEGRTVIISTPSPYTLTFEHEAAGTANSERLKLADDKLVLRQNEHAVFRFSGRYQRWLCVGVYQKADRGTMVVLEEKSPGLDGTPYSGSGYDTILLNKVDQNSISGASLASNQIILPSGTFLVKAVVPFYTGSESTFHFKGRVRDVTNSVSPIIGTMTRISDDDTQYSHLLGVFTLSAPANLEIQGIASTGAGNFGKSTTSGIGTEVYTVVVIEKVG